MIYKKIFSSEEVKNLNSYQRSGKLHPFTCGGNRGDEAHKKYAEEHNDPDRGLLIATEEGWICPVCEYRQDWAHDFMKEWNNETIN